MKVKQFAYQAYDADGKLVNGTLDVETEREVISTLRGRRLTPVKVEPARQRVRLFDRTGIGTRDLIDFTDGLCTLVTARVPLDRALLLLEGITEKPALKQLVATLRREVKEGKSLADAMEDYPRTFSRMYVNIVRAGEEGGILHELLPTLGRFLNESEETKRHVISAMIYPLILAFVGVLSVILLLVFVVPQFAALFEDAGAAIPPSAAFLLSLSGWLKTYGWLLLLLPIGLVYGWRWMAVAPERRLGRDRFLLSTPLLGQLLLYQQSATFCRTLGALLGAGIPLLRGLRIARGVIDNRILVEDLQQVEEEVRSGMGLGRALENTGRFPILLHQLVVVGEESGRTSSILTQLAQTFDAYVRNQMTRLVAFLEPALILLLGVFVGTIVVVMLSAVFSINDVGF